MKRIRLSIPLLACLTCLISRAADTTQELYCTKSSEFLRAPESGVRRNYARDREIDILHLAIDVAPDFTNRTVSGKTRITFQPIAKPFEELHLDAVNLRINSITSSETILDSQVTEDEVIVNFKDPIPPGREAWVEIEHSAEPEKGMYFRTPEMGYKEGDTHLFTQGEAIEARHWYPCYDEPNEKFTSEVTCRVPEGMTVLSNGRLVSDDVDSGTGLRVVHWSQDKPHVNYLVALVAGYFEKLEDTHNNIPLAFYTLPSDFDQATNSFQDTKDIMAFFEDEIGVPFPWAKYYQVTVNDFVAGGMENTSLTILTDGTLFTTNTENIRTSQGLVAHEMAHQWFGDLTTCKDWSHIWLNEGFATYYAALYDEHKNGRDSMLYDFYKSGRRITDRKDDTRPIVDRKYDQPMDRFGYLAYQKGSWVLHMLRSQLGDDLYRQCIRTWLERHEFGNVVTEDLVDVIEAVSGRSFDRFFDQWVYHAHHPELNVSYSWDARTKLAKISVEQTQKVSDEVLLFHFPLNVRFQNGDSTLDKTVNMTQQAEDFYVPLEKAPEIVRIDPDLALLAKIQFNPPNQMLYTQLKLGKDAIGRVVAAEGLSKKHDKASVQALRTALNSDSFYGVRIEAANALLKIGTPDALVALLDSEDQEDARVREQVRNSINGFFDECVRTNLIAKLETEENPVIIATLLQGLAAYPGDEAKNPLLGHLETPSYRNAIADAAIQGMKSSGNPSFPDPLLTHLQNHEHDFTSRGFARALDALASLSRAQEDKAPEREFLLQFVNDPRDQVSVGTIRALGTLGDEQALPVLTTFTRYGEWSPKRTEAERAIRKINESRPVQPELGDLRKEILDLKKANEDLRKDFNKLEKQFDATTQAKKSAEDRRGPKVIRSPRDRANH